MSTSSGSDDALAPGELRRLQASQPGASAPVERYRTFWPRFWAGFIDGLVFLPVEFLLWWISGLESSGWLSFATDVLNGIASLAYTILLHWRYGKTIGKMLMRVTVLTYEAETRITFRQSFLRESPWVMLVMAACILAGVALATATASTPLWILINILRWCSFVWYLVEIVTMLTNEKRRAVHDYIAGTVVVRDS